MKLTIIGVFLASAFLTVGCSQAIVRHDLFERSDWRIGRTIERAQRTCQSRQPKTASPSASAYERCVFETLRAAEPTE